MLAILIHRRRTSGTAPGSLTVALMAASSALALIGGVVTLLVQ